MKRYLPKSLLILGILAITFMYSASLYAAPALHDLSFYLPSLNILNTTKTVDEQNQQAMTNEQLLQLQLNLLQKKNQQLQTNLDIKDKQFGQLNQQIIHLQKQLANLIAQNKQEINKRSTTVNEWLIALYITGLAIVVIGLLLLFSVIKQRKAARLGNAEVSNVEEFTDNDDVVATKLDLATMYYNMEDYVAAEKLLKEVKEAGNAEQQAEAEKLLYASQSIFRDS